MPSDLAKSGNHFFIADYNNDCIRRLWHDGFAQIVLTIHSKPFALSGNLYVAARQTVYEVAFPFFHFFSICFHSLTLHVTKSSPIKPTT